MCAAWLRIGYTSLCKVCHDKLERTCHDRLMHACCDTAVRVCCDRLVAQGEGLLVRWGEEQSQAALQGLHTARQALLDLRALSHKQAHNQNAKRCATRSNLSLPLSGFCTRRKAPARPACVDQQVSCMVCHLPSTPSSNAYAAVALADRIKLSTPGRACLPSLPPPPPPPRQVTSAPSLCAAMHAWEMLFV